MAHEICAEYDDHTQVYGTMVEIDDSFDHAFGTEKVTSYEIKDIHVIVFIGTFDYDVTRSLTESELDYFKTWLIAKQMG